MWAVTFVFGKLGTLYAAFFIVLSSAMTGGEVFREIS
jgi:hypothetical protein